MLSGELYTQKIFSSLKYIFSIFSLQPCSVFAVVIGWNQISLYDLLPFIAHLGTQKCTDKWFICQVWKALALLELSKHTKWIRSQSQHQFCYNIKFLFFPIFLEKQPNMLKCLPIKSLIRKYSLQHYKSLITTTIFFVIKCS